MKKQQNPKFPCDTIENLRDIFFYNTDTQYSH